jgi:hypothetical protein
MKKIFKLLITLILFIISIKPVDAIRNDVFKLRGKENIEMDFKEGDVIRQTFVSPVDEFGIVAIRFTNNGQKTNDQMFFRIKEVGAEDWYYENDYWTLLFKKDDYYPFGFPMIQKAKGKKYLFEIELDRKTIDNSVAYFVSNKDLLSAGVLEINGEKKQGELNFGIANQKPAKEMIIEDINNNIKQDPYFYLVWIIIVLAFLGCLGYFYAKE